MTPTKHHSHHQSPSPPLTFTASPSLFPTPSPPCHGPPHDLPTPSPHHRSTIIIKSVKFEPKTITHHQIPTKQHQNHYPVSQPPPWLHPYPKSCAQPSLYHCKRHARITLTIDSKSQCLFESKIRVLIWDSEFKL
ncbi:hypothetical protein AAZX31_18G190200 [Glycine max]